MKVSLAPMEGVVDWVMRDTLTSLGGIDQCTTEFIRVTQYLHSEIVFHKFCPELRMGSKTRAGTPVFVQLLGGQPEPLAMNAVRAVELGAAGIDLNFGCPAKTVNRHDGGASLLKCPERIYKIVKTVRDAVPAKTPVTVKIRLGFEDPSACLENARCTEEAGASKLTVHCRTKTDGYKPPAHWEWMPRIREQTSIPLVANGEIWTIEDFHKCQKISGCDEFMIGRGALTNPWIFHQIKKQAMEMASVNTTPLPQNEWQEACRLLPGFFVACEDRVNGYFATSRTKQWLKALSLRHPSARETFDRIKIYKKPTEFRSALENELRSPSWPM